jgi:dihydrolipoamide dehydrogenase
MEKDLVVIGGGPGGYEAAIRAAQLGMKVCVVEKDKMGGTCTNRGCIPTKALYRHAEILNILHNIDEFGIKVSSYDMDVAVMQERKNKVVDQLRQGIEGLMKANDIQVIKGTGDITDSNTVHVKEENGQESVLKTKNIIIATGSVPAVPPFPGADAEGIFSSEDILNFTKVPEDLTIIGGGVIGMEFAGIFNAMGTKVTVVEFLPNILAQVDTDLTKRLLPMLKKKNMSINTSTKVVSIEKQEDRFVVNCEGKKGPVSFKSEAVLISTGRKPSIDQKRCEELGIEFTRQGIVVDENYETTLKGVYAIGDVNGKWMLAHAASHQGIQVAEHLAGMGHGELGKVIPGCIFIFPEISIAGVSEEEAKAKGIDYVTAKFMFGANGKALALGEPDGLVKVIANKADMTLIGVHIMGPHASDLIHEGVLAIEKKLMVSDMAHIVHAHPTLSESFAEAVLGLEGRSIQSYPPKK